MNSNFKKKWEGEKIFVVFRFKVMNVVRNNFIFSYLLYFLRNWLLLILELRAGIKKLLNGFLKY